MKRCQQYSQIKITFRLGDDLLKLNKIFLNNLLHLY